MQLHILNDIHDQFLQNKLNITLDEFKTLPFSEMDNFVDETLMWIECDGNSYEKKIAAEIIDSIYGPYDGNEINANYEKIERSIAKAV